MHKYGEEKKMPPLSPPELMVTFPKKKNLLCPTNKPWAMGAKQRATNHLICRNLQMSGIVLHK